MIKTRKISKLQITGLILFVIGVNCFILKGFTPSELSENGILIEPYFFLLPVGYFFIFLSLLTGAISFIIHLTKK
ncbi:DUF3955 domain-containing protein [Vagococcus carniphilus]|uniref:DUF3955 domain-containing protein n=1 Tax=Vagococcus carniphilus TaxID=218144 RepID=A0AAW8U3S7_9ENTE|nr:DUF3955 domain-containing protein [Vagococcus carniphilus]MDT2834260.1 DUF3955 domain-containing protein [Vagococcus carniphilus]